MVIGSQSSTGDLLQLLEVVEIAEVVGTVPISAVTGADMSHDGSRLVIRSYDSAMLWERATGSSIVETVTGPPCPLPLPQQPQGEAIAFAGAQTLVLLSELVGQPVYVLTEQNDTMERWAP